jgi:small subunit ribosomal protein S21
MIVVPIKEGDNLERALKKLKRKFEKTGVVKELRERQKFTKPSVINHEKRLKAIDVQHVRQAELDK